MNTKHSEYGSLPASVSPDGDDGFMANDRDSRRGGEADRIRKIQTFLNVAVNVLEWYAFAVFGYLSDVLGEVFFGSSEALFKSFVVFGGAFFVRPLGGLLFGYLGDKYGRQHSLVGSVLLMAFATTGIALLPTFQQVGPLAFRLLIVLRLLQGVSAGGQLMSSLVFGIESYPKETWGLMGSFVIAGANFGNFFSGFTVYWIRKYMRSDQIESWGWRAVNLVAGLLLLLCGILLERYSSFDRQHHHESSMSPAATHSQGSGESANPVLLAFSKKNRRALLAACMVPVLGSSGFWLSFTWMSVFMYTMSPHPMEDAFGVNSAAMFLGVILFFPVAGHLSDVYGKKKVMTIGGLCFGIGSPIMLEIISEGNPWWAFFAQLAMAVMLSFWCAPMNAWLAESFERRMRLTSVAVGYNVGVGVFSGTTPAVATYCVTTWGYQSAGCIFVFVSTIGLLGLWVVAPQTKVDTETKEEDDVVRGGASETRGLRI